MKNKFSIGFASVLSIVLLATSVTSAASNGNPWAEVWVAINSLKDEVANIQLIPGPQGPRGETGPAGAGISRQNVYQSSSAFYPVPSYGRQVQAIASCHD